MGAMSGFLFARAYTAPALAELVVTPDVLGRVEGDSGPLAYFAAAADLRANPRRLRMAAGLYALVRARLGVGLERG